MTSSLDPDVNVGFLIHDVSRMMRAWFDERAQEMGLTRAQWRVLVHLAGREGLNQSALAEILELDTVTLGRHIDRLERDGWLERRADPADRRAWLLHLTGASRPSVKDFFRAAHTFKDRLGPVECRCTATTHKGESTGCCCRHTA